LFELGYPALDALADGAEGDLENVRDFLIRRVLHVEQGQREIPGPENQFPTPENAFPGRKNEFPRRGTVILSLSLHSSRYALGPSKFVLIQLLAVITRDEFIADLCLCGRG
jgi:hypothetical protein